MQKIEVIMYLMTLVSISFVIKANNDYNLYDRFIIRW